MERSPSIYGGGTHSIDHNCDILLGDTMSYPSQFAFLILLAIVILLCLQDHQ